VRWVSCSAAKDALGQAFGRLKIEKMIGIEEVCVSGTLVRGHVRRYSAWTTNHQPVKLSPALELHEDTLLGTGAGAALLVEEVGSPIVGINADLANLYRVPELADAARRRRR
jgi:hypothetical protein